MSRTEAVKATPLLTTSRSEPFGRRSCAGNGLSEISGGLWRALESSVYNRVEMHTKLFLICVR
jgi:hypothetical protein